MVGQKISASGSSRMTTRSGRLPARKRGQALAPAGQQLPTEWVPNVFVVIRSPHKRDSREHFFEMRTHVARQ